jgi:hypothetical protein
LRRIGWGENIECIRKIRFMYRILIGKFLGKNRWRILDVVERIILKSILKL